MNKLGLNSGFTDEEKYIAKIVSESRPLDVVAMIEKKMYFEVYTSMKKIDEY